MDGEPSSLGRLRTLAHLLDESVRVPGVGVHVGLDPLLGLLPVAGDVVTGLCSLYIVLEAGRLGVSRRALARMLLNVALDVGIGAVPVVGDLFDAIWKANVRNVDLAVADLERQG
ncbi:MULTISPECIES: DUF4112 domain-containing protein [Haloarcula]|uniref:DUF4112 domain-containing protein n=1 Tax=Haloarcula pellucida TaxID=1427151 RepID=A0A830GHK6_9EURY|nr:MULTISPECIES: DUF4112 domain-containing protein [Halomicroarcula]MBX0346734.1 DUF4112 domain-containing protein [Halomicroarcula pellucida]MDS0277409.1 DUF4112 domain-containing protein [Halomicroarcula sp. S1AR25-4]GGN85271.1 hypothetical protein GCM10009030_01530 [Halomicroarcula pellucida]